MRKQIITCLLITMSSVYAGESSCKYEYTEFAREIFINDICSKIIEPSYNRNIFRGSYKVLEKMKGKYCDNTPVKLCQDDIHRDAIALIDKGLDYIRNNPALASITDFESFFTPIKEYISDKSGIPQVSIMKVSGPPGSESEEIRILGLNERRSLSLKQIRNCNAGVNPFSSLTCIGELKYFIEHLFQKAKYLSTSTHLNIVGKCLEEYGFGDCPYKQFK